MQGLSAGIRPIHFPYQPLRVTDHDPGAGGRHYRLSCHFIPHN